MLTRGSIAVLFTLASLSSAQGKLWIVDDDAGAGVDFTTVHDAVAAAADGDTLLFKSGEYDAKDAYSDPAVLQLSGKGLVLTAERNARVVLKTSFQGLRLVAIDNLAAHQKVVVSGFELVGGSESIIQMTGNQGSVRFEDCRVVSSGAGMNLWALQANGCADVTLVRTDIQGHGAAIAAIAATSSNLHLYDCDVRGGHGPESWTPLNHGGDALLLESGSLVAARSSFRGGNGGDFIAASCPGFGAGDAGDGLQVLGGKALLTDVALAPGAPGRSHTAGCPDGAPGAALVDPGGNVTILPSPAHLVQVETPLRTGREALILLTGRPGELAFAVASKDTAALFQPALGGALLVGAPLATLAAGTVELWGSTTVRTLVPPLAPGVEAQTLHVQGVFFDPATSGVTLGAAQSVAIFAQ